MKNKIVSFLFLVIISQNLFSQIQDFSNWLGEWTATYVNNLGDKQNEYITIKWAHFESWLEFDITGYVIEKPEMKWSSMMVLTLDSEHNIVGWYIDENGYNTMATIKGVIEDNRLILKYESLLSSGKDYWEIIDGILHCKAHLKDKESGKIYDNERVFTRKL